MNYFITRDKQMMGRFSELDIRYGLAEGKFYGSDMGWCAGMREGRPLDELIPPGNKPLPPRKPKSEEVQVSYAHPLKRHGSSSPKGTSALAIFTFLMGILCLLTCGLLGVGALITVIMGHVALSRIGKSHGALGGKGIAMSGLVMGYLSLLSMALIAVVVTLPVFTDLREQVTRQVSSGVTSVTNAQSIVFSCQQYANKHDGLFPENLEVLVAEKYIKDPGILIDPLLKDDSQTGYEYLGEGMKLSDPGDAIVLKGKSHFNNMRLVARKDGTVTFVASPAP